jgi:hypothetical protein
LYFFLIGGPPAWGARAAPSRQGGTDVDLLAELTPGGGGLDLAGWDDDLGGGEPIDFGGVLGVGISGTKTSALVPSRKIWVWIVPETLVEEVVTATGASSSIGVSLWRDLERSALSALGDKNLLTLPLVVGAFGDACEGVLGS